MRLPHGSLFLADHEFSGYAAKTAAGPALQSKSETVFAFDLSNPALKPNAFSIGD